MEVDQSRPPLQRPRGGVVPTYSKFVLPGKYKYLLKIIALVLQQIRKILGFKRAHLRLVLKNHNRLSLYSNSDLQHVTKLQQFNHKP